MILGEEQDPDGQEVLSHSGMRSDGPSGRRSWLTPVLAVVGVTAAVVLAVAMAAHARDGHERKANVALPLPAHRSTTPTPSPTPTTFVPTTSLRPKPQPTQRHEPQPTQGPEPEPTQQPGPQPTQPQPNSTRRQGSGSPSRSTTGGVPARTRSTAQPGPSDGTPSPRATPTRTTSAPTTYAEEAYNKHGVPTFADYANASGQGPDIQFEQVVQVTCKIFDPSIPSASPAGYWYLIASSPWDNHYYAVANTFLNGLSPTDPNTNYYDPRVPNCQ
jgi:hypothetical protein